jgi:isopropylmalate/homocitrate/citramalate synthase
VAVLELMYGYDTGIALAGLQALAEFVADAWNQPIPAHMPVVGRTAFSHATEVHYFAHDEDGAWAWNSWLPEVVGNDAYVPLCMYSGVNAVRRKTRELGLGELDEDAAVTIVERVHAELRLRRTELDDGWFAQTVRDALAGDRR